MKHTVFLDVLVQVKVPNIEASSDKEAVDRAIEILDGTGCIRELILDYPSSGVEYIRGLEDARPEAALVDHEGDEEYRNSRWYKPAKTKSGWKAWPPVKKKTKNGGSK